MDLPAQTDAQAVPQHAAAGERDPEGCGPGREQARTRPRLRAQEHAGARGQPATQEATRGAGRRDEQQLRIQRHRARAVLATMFHSSSPRTSSRAW